MDEKDSQSENLKKELKKELKKYELSILHDVFSSEIDKLLADELWEVSAEGVIHSRDEICNWLKKKSRDSRWDIKNFDVKNLSAELALVSYWAKMSAPVVSGSKGTLHSSLWKRCQEKSWQMIFHQATKICSATN
ncbi:MAG: DUF4440 domain-containing protein [Pseudohongiellaceae bacterium]